MTALFAPGPDVFYLVDLSGYVFRAYHAIGAGLTSPTGETTHATLGTITMLQRLIADRKPTHIAVVMDSTGDTFRHAIDARYKAHRNAPPEDLPPQMARCRQIVEAYGLPLMQEEGVEADDLIACLVGVARKENLRVVIVSADKDLMQLVGPDVVMWDTMRNKVYGDAEVREKFGVGPTQMRDLLALMGDTSDNVPGVPSVGPKTASELLTKYETLEGIYEHLAEIPRKKLQEALRDHKADALISQRLVTLKTDCQVPLRADDYLPKAPDTTTLKALFTELGFVRLAMTVDGLPAPPTKVGDVAPPPPPKVERTARIVDDEASLAAFVATAKTAEHLAIHAEMEGTLLVGLSLATSEHEGVYVPFAHRALGGVKNVPMDVARALLGPLLKSDSPAKIGHDVKHEEVVLGREFDGLGAVFFDTMIGSYLLDPEAQHALEVVAQRELAETLTLRDAVVDKVRGKSKPFDEVAVDRAAAYAAPRAAIIHALMRRHLPRIDSEGMEKLFRDVEIPLSRSLADLERRGVELDSAALAIVGQEVDAKIVEVEKRAEAAAGHPFNITAPRQIETLLFDELGLKPVKRTKTARSTDAETLEILSELHPLPEIILEHRQLTKLKSTYIDTLPLLVDKRDHRLHTRFNQAVAATGRLSSSDPNLQNIPIRTDLGRAIRGAFVAPAGAVVLSADYSQIELRVLAHLSHDPVLVDAFQTGQDIHERTAMEIFQVAATDVTGDQRRAAKTINFGVIYGMGDSALAKRLGIPRMKAAEFIAAYFRRYAGVRTYMNQILEQARSSGSVGTLLGRRRFLPELTSANRAVRLGAERIAQNTPIQGSAADILKLAMVKLREPVEAGVRMVLTVHDELVFEVPSAQATSVGPKIKAAMESVVTLDVPLVVEVGHGRTWAEAHG